MPEGHKALGFGYVAKGWERKALETYKQALKLNPNFAPAVGNIGDQFLAIGQLDEALRWRKKSVELNPTMAINSYYVARAYSLLADDANAEKWYNKVLELQPDFHDAYNELGWIYLKQGEYKLVPEQSRKALSIVPDCVDAFGLAGQAELLQGRYRQAKEYFERANKIDSASYLTSLGYVLWKTGQIEKAGKTLARDLKRAQKQLEEGREWPGIPHDIAAINAIQGNKPEAYKWLEKAVAAGWRDYRWGWIDPKLENLRNEDRFKQMMAEVKGNVEAMRRRAEEEEKN